MFTPVTSTRSSVGYTRSTSPDLPLSRPDVTITRSPFLTLAGISEHLRRQRNDLHMVLGAKLARHGPEDAGANRLVLGVDQHGGIAVETDQRAVRTPDAMRGAHDDCLQHFALL